MNLYLSKKGSKERQPALFEQSIFNYFDITDTSFVAQINVSGRDIILSVANDEQKNDETVFTIPIGRSPHCPMIIFSRWTLEKQKEWMRELNSAQRKFENVSLAMSVLLENKSTKHVLITRRAKHLRSFPGVWVLPGGGIEEHDKDMIDTAQRELQEETGISASRECFSPIAMWESVFPTFIHQGSPRRHHLVIYVHASVNLFQDHSDQEVALQILKPQLEEVDAIAWLHKDSLKKLFEYMDKGEMLPNTEENSFKACVVEKSVERGELIIGKNPAIFFLSQLQVSPVHCRFVTLNRQ